MRIPANFLSKIINNRNYFEVLVKEKQLLLISYQWIIIFLPLLRRFNPTEIVVEKSVIL
jgi:hypothetical protein